MNELWERCLFLQVVPNLKPHQYQSQKHLWNQRQKQQQHHQQKQLENVWLPVRLLVKKKTKAVKKAHHQPREKHPAQRGAPQENQLLQVQGRNCLHVSEVLCFFMFLIHMSNLWICSELCSSGQPSVRLCCMEKTSTLTLHANCLPIFFSFLPCL